MKKIVTCLMLLCYVISMSADDIYLSSLGSDGNDGSTSDQAVATLGKALSLVPTSGTDHIIKVSGIIDISKEVSDANGVTLNKKIYFSIEGTSNKIDGFSGEGTTRILQINGAHGSVTLKNLLFSNGNCNEGGAIRSVNSGTVLVKNCVFTGNTTTGNSGTLHLYNTTQAIVEDCSFTNNKAKCGGGIHQNKGGNVIIRSCNIEDNNSSTILSSTGGGIYIGESNGFSIDKCIIRNNKVLGNGGGITILNTSYTQDTVRITNTLIASNESVNNNGGGVFVNNATANKAINVFIINSTIYDNLSKLYGGAVYASGAVSGSSFNLINSTVVENHTQGNGGHGAGINFRDASVGFKKYIYNTILEDNTAVNNGEYSDITSNNNPNEVEDDLFIRNSYVGAIVAAANTYTDQLEYNNRIRYGAIKAAGLAQPVADYITSQNSIPLDFDSDGIDWGNAKYLTDLNISTDQLNNIRLFKGNKCAIGSVEIPADLVVTNPDPHDYLHFIIYGQSLSVGHESYYSLSLTNVDGNYMIGDQVWLNGGNTTMNKLNPLVATKMKNAVIGENCITSAANHIRIKQESEFPNIENRFIATSVGVGGKTIEKLSKGHAENHYPTYETALKSANSIVLRSGGTINCPAIVWMQGEYDYTETAMPKDDYKAAMLQLKNDMQGDAIDRYKQTDDPIFYTYQSGTQYTRGKELAVGMAQLEASNENEDVICVGPVYPMTDVGGHLDANGTRWFGEMIGKVYYKTKVQGEDFKPLQPKELRRDITDSKKVIVQFVVPKLPLAFDTKTLKEVKDYGFEVYNNNARQTITNIEIENDCVILTCQAGLTGKIEVVYAGVNAVYTENSDGKGRGHGNLRDSDDYTATSNYINPELKDGEGNYVYPHYNETESYSYIPSSGEPKDESGDVIYDKPYPLYNFSLSFYYAIPEGEDKFEVPNLDKTITNVEQEKQEDNIQIKQIAKTLQISVSNTNGVIVNLTDISGKIVKTIRENKSSAQLSVEWDLSSLVSGVYIVNIWSSNGLKTKKIVL